MHNLSLPLRTNSGFLQYFENLAESDPDIQHKPGVKERQRFFRDFDDLTGLHISDFCMLAIPAPARYDGGSDNLHRIFLYDMYILHPPAPLLRKRTTPLTGAWPYMTGCR